MLNLFRSAKDLPPSMVPSFNASVMSTLSSRVSKLFGDVMPTSFGSTPPKSRVHSPDGRPSAGQTPNGFELSGHNQMLQGSRAERRWVGITQKWSARFVADTAFVKVCSSQSTWHSRLPAGIRGKH